MPHFSFLDKALLRTPLRPVQRDITTNGIETALSDSDFREALYLGSPSFYARIMEGSQLDEKKLRTLYKYYSRFANRCTPFGLFATIGVLSHAKTGSIDVTNAEISKKVGYDMHFLGMLNERINAEHDIRKILVYYPNNSLYRIRNTWRYVEYYYRKTRRLHRMAEVTCNDSLERILHRARQGCPFDSLVSLLTNDQVPRHEAEAFLHEIIDSQFLNSELDITLTGEDYLSFLISVFSEPRFQFSRGQEILDMLTFLQGDLLALSHDHTLPEDYSRSYERIKQRTKSPDLEENRLFQVDAFKDFHQGTLGFDVLRNARTAITVLNRLSTARTVSGLGRFIKEFTKRYGEQAIPLCQALDPDSGIGYTNISGAKTPLIETLPFEQGPTGNPSMEWNSKHEFLYRKIGDALQKGFPSVQLTDSDISQFQEDPERYPRSFSVFFSTFIEQGEPHLHVKSVSGPSANNLIGRFGHLDRSILSISEDICRHEERADPERIYAEIVHLPEARTGNVLHRKFQRKHEIPYLAKSSLSSESQIPIDDLYIRVQENGIVLFSQRLGREIVPRLGNAHNYVNDSLPIYRFLCDLQDPSNLGLSLDLGGIASVFPFLPRIGYKNIILSRARWRFTQEDLFPRTMKTKDVAEEVREFSKRQRLPDVVALCEGDNELVINFGNPLACKVFYDMARKRQEIILREFLMSEPAFTAPYANEFLLFGMREGNIRKEHVSQEVSFGDKDAHVIGGEWCYYKIYCGNSMADDVLRTGLAPALDFLEESDLIRTWFFIRFIDEDGHHLRFRCQPKRPEDLGKVAVTLHRHLADFVHSQAVWNIQMDTYRPEKSRYGPTIMAETETCFHFDSECALRFLGMIRGDEGEKERWLFAMLSIDRYLDDLGLDLKKKTELIRRASDDFGKEFGKGKALGKKINRIYSDNVQAILEMMQLPSREHPYQGFHELLADRSASLKESAHSITSYLDRKVTPLKAQSILLSHVHMVANRLFLTHQRKHEAVVYDLLYQYYRSKAFRKK